MSAATAPIPAHSSATPPPQPAPPAPDTPDPAAQADALGDVPEGRLLFYTAARESVSLERWYKGAACFLVCGGPSLLETNLGLLRTPGVVTWALNNSWAALDRMPGRLRPTLWSCIDPAERFCWRGMVDPAITKVLPLNLAGQRLRVREPDGSWRHAKVRVRDCPAVWFYARNCRFEPADFFAQASVCCGNEDGHTDSLGVTGVRSVMLAALRLVVALGFRTINLLGCDFRMEGSRGYAAEQRTSAGHVEHNNRLFAAMNTRLTALAPCFELEGVKVFNCTPGSGLTAFPFRPLHDAVSEATAWTAGPIESVGWYDRQPTPAEQREADRHLWSEAGGD